MDTLNEIVEFKTSLPIRRKLASYSIVKIFQAGEVCLVLKKRYRFY
ncbi:MAG: hypothetical protein Q8861_06805 [Bacteroidota bacterium]|nr:hypothetical protein [Bacteroidota bacterium]